MKPKTVGKDRDRSRRRDGARTAHAPGILSLFLIAFLATACDWFPQPEATDVKQITSFELAGTLGTINQGAASISVNLAASVDVSGLTPTISFTGERVSPDPDQSQDFSNPVEYTVRAWDGSVKSYLVTVTQNIVKLDPIGKAFWGRWLGVGDAANWYISVDAVLRDGEDAGLSAVGTDSLSLNGGSLRLNGDDMLIYQMDGYSVPFFLYRSAGANSSFAAALKDSSLESSLAARRRGPSPRSRSASRGLSGLGGIKVLVKNKKNPADLQELSSDELGNLEANGTIAGDDYTITVPVQDGIDSEISTTVTPLYDGQDLGILDLVNGGANFKMNLRSEVRADLLLADGLTSYPVTVEISNVGKTGFASGSFSVSADDGLLITEGNVADILGTVEPGQTVSFGLSLACEPISADTVDRYLNVTILDEAAGVSWNDRVSVRFRRDRSTFAINVASNIDFYNGITCLVIDPDGVPVRTDSMATNFVWKPGEYTLAFALAPGYNSGKYSIGVDVLAPAYHWAVISGSAKDEVANDSAATAQVLGFRGTTIQYLDYGDIDFFKFTLPEGLLDISSSLENGIYEGAQTVASLSASQGDALIYYTKDGSQPSAKSNRYTGGSISVGAGEYLYAYAAKDGYWPTISRIVDRQKMVKVPAGSFVMPYYNGMDSSNAPISVSAFSISNTEISRGQYNLVIPGSYATEPARPAEKVSWYQAIAYCNLRSMAEGLQPVYGVGGETDPDLWDGSDDGSVLAPKAVDSSWDLAAADMSRNGYRLPTEAELIYASKGGAPVEYHLYSGSDEEGLVAWKNDNSSGKSHPVGTKLPNRLGIYDLSGNLREWCWDWYSFSNHVDPYPMSAVQDPSGPEAGDDPSYPGRRAVHCGGFTDLACSLYACMHGLPYESADNMGFRVVRRP